MLCPICGLEARKLPLRLCKCSRALAAHRSCLADYLALQDFHSGSVRFCCFFCRHKIRISFHRAQPSFNSLVNSTPLQNVRNFWLISHLNLFLLTSITFIILVIFPFPTGLPGLTSQTWQAGHRLFMIIISVILLTTVASYIRVVDGEWKKMGCNFCSVDGPVYWRLHGSDQSSSLDLSPSSLLPEQLARCNPRDFPLITREPHLFLMARTG